VVTVLILVFISGCENEAKPLASVTCGSGSQRCPGGYQCISPPFGGAGVCCRRGKYRVSNKMKSTKYHTVRAMPKINHNPITTHHMRLQLIFTLSVDGS